MATYIITEYDYDTRINYIFNNYEIANKIYDIYYNDCISNIDSKKRKGVLSADLFKEVIEPGIDEELYISYLLKSTHSPNLNYDLDVIEDIYVYSHWSEEYEIWLRERLRMSEKETVFSKMKYTDYLKSDYWKVLRKKRLKLDNYKCAKCGETSNLQVHHKTYIFRGYGIPDEINNLITLCKNCHQEHRDKENQIDVPF